MENRQRLIEELQLLEDLEKLDATHGQHVFFINLSDDISLFKPDVVHNKHIAALFPRPMPRDEIQRICNQHLINGIIWKEMKTY